MNRREWIREPPPFREHEHGDWWTRKELPFQEYEVLVRSTARRGRFMVSEREEMGGRVQSWVLAGEKGAAEIRGTGRDRLYLVMHCPVRQSGEVGHGVLVLVDAEVFPVRCPVLEGPCRAWLGVYPFSCDMLDLTEPWEYLEAMYRQYLEPS